MFTEIIDVIFEPRVIFYRYDEIRRSSQILLVLNDRML